MTSALLVHFVRPDGTAGASFETPAPEWTVAPCSGCGRGMRMGTSPELQDYILRLSETCDRRCVEAWQESLGSGLFMVDVRR